MTKAAKDLQDAIMPIGAKMYQAQAEDAKNTDKKADSKEDEAVEGEVVNDK